MSLLFITTNFALHQGDAVQDLRAAARFAKRASIETLGRHFVSVRADNDFPHIQRVTFNVEGPAMPVSLQALVDELGRKCREEIRTESGASKTAAAKISA